MSDTPTDDTAKEIKNIEPLEDKTLSPDEEIDAAIDKSSIKAKKKLTRKKQIKYGIIAGVIALLSFFIIQLFKPFQGSMAFGLCKTFLELNVRYPHTLYLSTVQELGLSVRIWYTQIDSFGEYRMEPIQCYFKEDETYGFIMEKVTIQRRPVDPKMVEDFNRSLPVLLANPPNLDLPAPLPDSLQGLQIDSQRFRRPIL